jgi:cytochrome P450
MTLRAMRRNFIEAFPRSTYEEGVTWIKRPFNETLMVTDPELIREMLVEKAESFGRNPITLRTHTPVLGESSVFITEGEDWRWKRRALSSSFRHETLLSFVPEFVAAAARQVERWRELPRDRPVDVDPDMRKTTFEVIVGTMLGGPASLDFAGYGNAISEALEAAPWLAVLALLSAPPWIPFPGQRRVNRARDYLQREVSRIVAERRRNPAARPDLLDLLLAARDPQSGRAMTEAELVSNLITFLTAGHEVSALALTWALWLIAKDDATQRRVLHEAQTVTGGKPIDVSQIEALIFTRQVIQEAMRLFPPAALILRQAKMDVSLGDQRVKAGTHVNIPVFSLHRHVRLWHKPNSFNPDRFSPDEAKARSRYAYLPFGAGARVCIGASFAMIETTVILASLVQAFRLRPMAGHQPKPITTVPTRVQGGMPLLIEPR